MVFSERTVVHFQHGVRFRSDSLRSIGVYDKTQCWGLWTPDITVNGVPQPSCIRGVSRHHFVVSPFHPVSWPYLVAVRLELVDHPEALPRALRRLSRISLRPALEAHLARTGIHPGPREKVDGLNILHIDQSPTGFAHMTCVLVAEVLAVRDMFEGEKEALDRGWPQTREPRSRQRPVKAGQTRDLRDVYKEALDFGQRLARAMLLASVKIRGFIKKNIEAEHLYPRLVKRDFVTRPRGLAAEADTYSRLVLEAAARHAPRASSVRWLYGLPYHAVFGGGEGAPIRFVYDENAKQLRAVQPFFCPTPDDAQADFDPGRNYLAVAIFDPLEHFLRLVPIPDAVRRERMAVVDIEYKAFSLGAERAGLTEGFMADTVRAIGRQGFEVLSALNKPRESSRRRENGHLRFLVIRSQAMSRPIKDRSALRARIQALQSERNSKPHKLRDAKVRIELSVRCAEPAVSRLFISLNFNHPRLKNIKKLIERACHASGMEAVFAESYTDTATDMIVSRINGCDGFLQILVEPPMDQTRKRTWLDFEYGMASGRGMPRMRLVDVSSRPYELWGEIVETDRDRYCRPIHLAVGDHELLRQLKRAIREIASKVGRDEPPTDRPLPT